LEILRKINSVREKEENPKVPVENAWETKIIGSVVVLPSPWEIKQSHPLLHKVVDLIYILMVTFLFIIPNHLRFWVLK
jgi:hypothetical protein